MKKNVFMILLALVLALSCLFVAAPNAYAADDTTTEVHTDHCVCVNTDDAALPEDHVCPETVTWEAFTGSYVDGGHYYLTADTAKAVTISTKMEITICLNGHLLRAGKALTVYGGGVVNICNCKTEGRIHSTRTTGEGFAVRISSSDAEGAFGTVNLYSGNISGSANSGAHCRAVEVKGGIFNMYGGQVVNGWTGEVSADTAKLGYGGNVCVYNNSDKTAQFNMYGGTITGGKATVNGGNVYIESGAFTFAGGTINGGNAGTSGGNVWIGGGVKPVMGDGTIQNGEAVVSGGNVYLQGAQLTMNDGTISGGKVTGTPTEEAPLTGAGGNIYVCSTGAIGKFTMNGGTVENGSAALGGNIAGNGQNVINSTNGKAVNLIINDGTVKDGTATVKGGNIYLHNTTNGATLAMKAGTISGGQAPLGGNIASYQANPTTSLTGGTISGGVATVKGGNIYVESSDEKVNTFTLAGTTVTGGIAKLVETAEDGTETVTWGDGGNIYVAATSKLSIKSGEISNGQAGNGGNIYFAENAVLEQITGTLTGGIADANGGSIYAINDIDLTGATISGGIASSNGGNVWSDKTVTIGEGTAISGGSAVNGGNIYITGNTAKLDMTDGAVTGGNATSGGGNIYTLNSPNVLISGGSITGGSAKNGGNLYVTNEVKTDEDTGAESIVATRKLVVTSATISGGSATANGGNIYVRAGTVTITAATIADGSADGNGGNIYADQKAVFEDDPATEDKNEGGVLTITSLTNEDATITPTTISGGSANSGGNIYAIRINTINMTDCQVSGGSIDANSAKVNGGNIYFGANGQVNITGGTYTSYWGNRNEENKNNYKNTMRVSGNGGNICINSGAVSITDAKIYGGDANTAGGAIYNAGQLTLTNVTAKSAGGASGKVLYIAQGASATVENCELVNWGTGGSCITNAGTLTLKGNISMPKEYSATEIEKDSFAPTNDILLDASNSGEPVIDITALTTVDNGLAEAENYWFDGKLTVNKAGDKDSEGKTHTIEGLVAIGATETTSSLLEAKNIAYQLKLEGTEVYLVGKAVQGLNGNDVVTGYASLNELMDAIAEADDGATWYILNADMDGQTISKSIMLDLCGHDLIAEITEGTTVSVIDSANDKYDAAACGKLTYTGAGTVESIVHTTGNQGGATKHYVILKNADGSYSAHRYVAAVNKMSLKPHQDALGFKATYSADEMARAAVVNYGISVWVNENHKITNTKTEGFDDVGHDLSLRVQNVLAYNGGEMTIYGDAFITFNVDGQEIVANTSAKNASMKVFIETMEAGMADGSATYSDEQITAVQELLTKFASKVAGWDIDTIQAWPAEIETPETETTEPTENT